jgi:antirestriction protein ArdC
MGKLKISSQEDSYRFINSRFTEQLARGSIPWHTTWKERPMDIFGGPYCGINLWLLLNTHYSRNIFLSKAQITSFKLAVKKKEQGHSVLAGIERRGKQSITLRKVYNMDQLQGFKEWWISPLKEHNSNIRQRCNEIVEKMPSSPQIIKYGSSVFYSVKDDTIYMPREGFFKNDQQIYSALFYALVQSTGHSKRLNRETCKPRSRSKQKLFSREELIAEMGCTLLCSCAGIDPWYVTKYHTNAKGWFRKMQRDIALVTIAAFYADQAVDYIFNVSGPKYQIARDYIL